MASNRDTWVGGDVRALPAVTRDVRPESPRPSPRAPLPPTGALEIGQALPVHAGRYTCTARNSAGVAHKHVVLAVQGKGPPAGGELEAGGQGCRGPGFQAPRPASLLCLPDGILWEKNLSPPLSSSAKISGIPWSF